MGHVPRWLRPALRLPLSLKLAGANALIAVATVAALYPFLRSGRIEAEVMVIAISALLLSLAVNLGLLYIALGPLRELERTAELVWRGDLDARVPSSELADRDMARLGGTMNLLLDGLSSERARLRTLASMVIEASDDERARIAHELHDSVAQTLAALSMQSAALARADSRPAREQLEVIRELASSAMEEVRSMSHTIHPRVLDDLGLSSALEWLARQQDVAVRTEVRVQGDASKLPPPVAAALYRVAQEAIRNAVRHATPRIVEVRLRVDDDDATLEIADDGRGFDVDEARARRPGMGLFAMRERMALVDGTLEIDSAAGRGTRVIANAHLNLDRAA